VSSILQPGGRRRRWPLWLGLAIVVVGAAALAVYLIAGRKPGNVSHPNVEFTAPSHAKKRKPPKLSDWPLYGLDPQRTRYLADATVAPPFRRPLWRFHGSSLIEFQPVVGDHRLFALENDGRLVTLGSRTGKVLWSRRIGALAASSPAWADGRVYAVANAAGSAGIASAGAGRLWCLNGRTGRVVWTTKLSSASESSPLVVGGRVYLGSQSGTVYALNAATGGVRWTYHAGAPVKAAPALSQGRLFFGDYSGEMTSLRARDGKLLWRASTSGRSFNRAGNFYATPAVAFGRVYAGNTDGFVYSFAAGSGQLAWRRSTGAYVYAAPAVADVPGMRPAVFAGSYSGKFYALDARSGNVIWVHRAGGKISGAASVIGTVVYFSTLSKRTTTGLDVRNGRPVWNFLRGAFNPAVSDGKRLYITGYSSIYAFRPANAPKTASRAPRAARKKSSRSARAKSGGSSR
jgi:outer membrane protein assembly factor BamB